ncbi:hypothetical protein Pmar_PMAR009605 [Perkinsus marinus ATCC 50983]|uniref:Uncharacterized protein n=1 Tax=Perkinsus marinus (strain ATCC 50983 / TXsc) TaxID=423536 RepID=C5KI98_PERM5|nr:hypothetical protein Pmar_PMAR009605 [Perkinsus marinus ATCC 50983]EER15795.1 hypothetical protein Pmar_PMAR009605 [Perkinsus marinus ATCC 50983]|eukprot:XP_002783999.1 hypothetical protein Pmar_PMAR009605 [Perkinsus marinus ATCC 50983]
MTESNNSNLAPDSNISVPVVEEGSGKPTVESTTEVSSPVKPDAKSDAKSGSTATGAVEATSTEMKDEVSNEGDHRREQRPRVSLVVPDATGGSDVSTHKPLKHPNRLMPKGLSTLGDEMPQYTRSVTTASGSQSGWNATKRGWNAKKDRSKILGRAMTHQVGSNYDRELHWLKP